MNATDSPADNGISGPTVTLAATAHPHHDERAALYSRRAGAVLDLGCWFNAAPVGWWRDLFDIDEIALTVTGVGRIEVCWAGPNGHGTAATRELNGVETISLAAHVDWYWVRWSADDQAATSPAMQWQITTNDTVTVPRVTVVVPTYGREADALRQVERLLAPELDDVVSRVLLIDQASTVLATPGAQQLIADTDRLRVIEQPNWGGSGGYARGMIESLAHPHDAVLLLDDDAEIEPEGLRRMVTWQAMAATRGVRLIVGTPLLSAEEPTRLTALAEGVARRPFQWGASDGLAAGRPRVTREKYDAVPDLAETDPADWSFAHPAAQVDYVGWWGALLPPGCVGEIGLPAPYFLKWDDAEYGLRAVRAGFRVTTVPGTGVWHPTWGSKGTIGSWAAWPLHRNRLATAAAYGAGRGVLLDSLVHQIKHVLSLQYRTAALWNAAMTQFLSGPGWLVDDWRRTRSDAQSLLRRIEKSESPRRPDPPASAESPASPEPPVPSLARAVLGLLIPASDRRVVHTVPERFGWRASLGADAVVVAPSDVWWRDPARARALLWQVVRLHAVAAARWPILRQQYRRALPASRTVEQWRRVISG